jgi:hypothetical protein
VTHQAEHLDDDLLSALVDEQLTPDERALVQAHLGTCSVCQQRLEELRSVAMLLRRLPELDPPRDFSLGPRLLADPPNVVRLRRWYAVTRIAAGTLAAAWLFLSAGALYVDSRPAAVSESARSLNAPAPAPAVQNVPPQLTVGVRAAVPAAAPQPQPAAGAAQPRPAQATPQSDDQVAAATSVNPLPTPVPTPRPTAVPAAVPLPVASAPVDAAAPLRGAAIVAGIVAILTLLATLLIRRRLRQAALHL